jgi:zinc/manganese transport system substrate-binding protein
MSPNRTGRGRIRPFTTASVLAALTISAAACGSPASPPAAAPQAGATTGSEPVAVVASTDVYGSIVAAIGGDRVTVTSIINSPDADPHEHEATPKDAAAVNDAKILVLNGGGYDDFATKLVDAAPTKPTVVNVVELSGLPGSTEASASETAPADATADPATGTTGAAAAGGEEHAEFNEHVWYSLPTMKKLADTLATDLAAADPGDAAAFTQNATVFKGKVNGLIGKLDAIKAAHTGEKVAITEPVPLYLVQEAGLVNATPAEFSEAAEEGTDPPAAVLNDTLALFTGKQVKALLPNAQTESASTRQVERAAAAAGIPQVPVTETLPPGVTDYVSWQGNQIDQLTSALTTAS